jgi:hypothetical protein
MRFIFYFSITPIVSAIVHIANAHSSGMCSPAGGGKVAYSVTPHLLVLVSGAIASNFVSQILATRFFPLFGQIYTKPRLGFLI